MEKYLNLDYRIVLDYGRRDGSCARKNERCLVGRRGLISAVGEELATRLVERAYKANLPKITCKLRRGLLVIFYSK